MSKILKSTGGSFTPDHRGDSVLGSSVPAPPDLDATYPPVAPGYGPGGLSAPSSKVLEREVVGAHQGARRILEQAQAEATALLATAQAEANTLRADAVSDGHAEGLALWESKLLELATAESRLFEEARGQLIALATRIAEKILRRRIEQTPEAILPMIEEALQASRGNVGSRLVLRVNPADAATVSDHRERLLAQNRGFESLEVMRDPTMARGGCRIETQYGTIDASLETQLKAIEQLLRRGSAT